MALDGVYEIMQRRNSASARYKKITKENNPNRIFDESFI